MQASETWRGCVAPGHTQQVWVVPGQRASATEGSKVRTRAGVHKEGRKAKWVPKRPGPSEISS